MADIQIINDGSLVGFTPLSDDGAAWLDDYVDDSMKMGPTYWSEPRYAGDIVSGILEFGLELVN